MNPNPAALSASFEYCPVLATMLAERKTVGRSGKTFDDITPLSTTNNLVALRRMMLEYRPDHTLEVGLSFGGSALVFAASHKDLGHSPARQHKAIDPFQASVWDDGGLVALERAGLANWVEHLSMESAIALPQLWTAKERFDLIYIDGSHLFEDVFVDLYFSVRLLSQGGIMVFDDCQKPQVAKALGFLRKNLSDSLSELNLGRFRLDEGRSLKYSLARLLRRTQMAAFQRKGETCRPWDAGFANF